ncbi:M16 family metallopeptidase [Hephaestia mangrovi]|uniref:M16 family metallopeptidase n=1 Tax=Hephaestia mangrovi TaxID=2873268 RepID=UPI001CA76F19|nr:insulinase family protein [Hephaestia mangrovi]MBY8828067.1 insulinase family protein [Hephaestia mangrovi]
MTRNWWLSGTSLLAALTLAQAAPAQVQASGAAAGRTAQATAPGIAAATSWEHEGSDIPADPAWVTGILPNGVRYAVRQNAIPQGTIAIRVRMDVGALDETPDQQGWSHLIEHMVFRGTKNYPDGDAVRIWQRLGASFGSDTNASTTYTATTFMLDLPKSDPASYKQAIDVLSDMMREASFDPKLLDTERQVVIAERQQRISPLSRKVQDAGNAIFLTGLTAAKRELGGTDATLAAATADKLKSFYHRWYRPDRAVVVVVGDADPQMLVAGIKQAFGDWRATGAPPPQPDDGKIATPPKPAAVVVDPQAPNAIQLAWMHPHDDAPFTIARQQAQFADFVATRIIAQRLATEAQQGKAIVNATANYPTARHVADQLTVSIVPKPGDWKAALDETFGVLNRLRETPPSQAEIDQQVAGIEEGLRKSVDMRQTENSPSLANTYIRDVDQHDVTPTRAFYLKLFQAAKASLTPDVVARAIDRQLAPDPRMILLSSTPVAGGDDAVVAALEAARKTAAAATEALRKVSLDELRIDETPGKVVSRRAIPDLGIQRVTFANGVELDYKQTPYEKGAIRLKVELGHGLYGRPVDDPGLLWSSAALTAAGFGPFTPDELTRLTAGRQIGFALQQAPDALTFTSHTDQQDAGDALKLITGAITQMRYAETPIDRMKNSFKATYQAYFAAPTTVLQAFGAPYFHGGDKRFEALPSPDTVGALTLDQFRAFWQAQLGQGPVKVVAVGDLDPDALVADVAKTLGALPPRPSAKPTAQELAVSARWTGKTPVILRHKGDPDQAAVGRVYPTTGVLKNFPESVALDVAASVIQDRLTSQFRETQGGSYTPFADSTQSSELPDYGFVLAAAQLRVERIGDFYKTLDSIIADLAAKGPTADELQRALSTKLSAYRRSQTNNVYWLGRVDDDLDDPRVLAAIRALPGTIEKVDAAAVKAAVQHWLAGAKHAYDVEALPQGVKAPS